MSEDTQQQLDQAKAWARAFLGGARQAPAEVLSRAKQLLRADEIGLARQILDRIYPDLGPDEPLRNTIRQQLALATYKDPHLNRLARLTRALQILPQDAALDQCKDSETLGLAGAIHKRLWELNARREDLERSMQLYRLGYRIEQTRDAALRAQLADNAEPSVSHGMRYTAINAAFMLDLLGEEESRFGGDGEARRREANEIREETAGFLGELLPNEDQPLTIDHHWPAATLAEALFGLGRYGEAETWLRRIRAIEGLPEWQFLSTARQLAQLARLHQQTPDQHPDMQQALMALLDDKAEGVASLFRPKIGLALSGGGFRASFYHIGLLARLAERDLLRHVEVLSCVSGGSILGVHYYLLLRNLLQTKPDQEITREDYIQLVADLADQFLAGVQRNPRMRILLNPIKNLVMAALPGYSRTHRLGELYEELLYSQVDDGEGQQPRWLSDLLIHPADEGSKFHPRQHNWRRRNKVPELVLNATTLNTGHNWQFTATWMGESPEQIDPTVDINDRYRRFHFAEIDASHDHHRVRLGHAVAASSCVPGLFEPLELQGVYPDRNVRLVDGGVFDNQGSAGLLEQDCDHLIVSDAAGQLGSLTDPGPGILSTLLRSNDILMERVRHLQHTDLKLRQRVRLLRGLDYIHLKQDLHGESVTWVGAKAPPRQQREAEQDNTPYGIRRDLQRRISELRTDLDSFSEAEACALMTSGYHIAEHNIGQVDNLADVQPTQHPWTFLRLDPVLKAGGHPGSQRLEQILSAGAERFFKVWRLNTGLKLFGGALAILAIYLIYRVLTGLHHWVTMPDQRQELVQLFEAFIQGNTPSIVLGALVVLGGGIWAFRQMRRESLPRKVLGFVLGWSRRLIGGIFMALFAWAVVGLHLLVFDRLYKHYGEVRQLLQK